MSRAPQYRRPSDVDFCQREAVALRRAAKRKALTRSLTLKLRGASSQSGLLPQPPSPHLGF